MVSSSVALFALAAITAVSAWTPDAEADRVTTLPGYSGNSTNYGFSGYLSAQGQKKLHYWFMPAESDPTNTQNLPVALWLTGGPGCSSMDAFLSEHGPFQPDPSGDTLHDNPYAWTKAMHIIYLEAPAGVGYSYSPDTRDYATNDMTVAEDNWTALQDLFTRVLPEFSSNPFGVTGESYGGVYVPSLTNLILENNAKQRGQRINLVFMEVGNPLSSYELNDNAAILLGYGHAIIGAELWDDLVSHCCAAGQIPTLDTCDFHNPSSGDCSVAVTSAMELVYGSGLNMYRLNGLCQSTAPPSPRRLSEAPSGPSREFLSRTHLFRNYPQESRMRGRLTEDVPCIDTYAEQTWLRRSDVMSALHIHPGLTPWSVCSAAVGSQYQRNFTDMTATYQSIFKLLPSIAVTIISGNDDSACGGLGNEMFVKNLGRQVVTPRRMFHIPNGQVGGQVVEYENIMFVSIKGCGHMAPQATPIEYPIGQPSAALYALETFILRNIKK